MKSLPSQLVTILLWLAVAAAAIAETGLADYGRLGPDGWNRVLLRSASLPSPSERIALLSEAFLGTPYTSCTLIGSPEEPERLVVELAKLDCFTLLDYVESLRRCAAVEELPGRLAEVRYRDGRIAYEARRHFFSDWRELPAIRDVTAEVGGERVRRVEKVLNRRQNGRPWLEGIEERERTVRYIPGTAVDTQVLSRLQSGDYVGIYSEAAGLDVSHTGIVVRRQGEVYLRHASSLRKKVVDVPLWDYLRGKPGLVVLRAQSM